MTYASEVLADSPYGYWKLDETSGTTAADSSGNGRTLTATNADCFSGSGTWVDGSPAARITATGRAINNYPASWFSGSPVATGTIELWFKLSATGVLQTLVGGWDGGAADKYLFVNDSNLLVAYIYDGSAKYAASTTTLTTGVWYHAVTTWDGSNLKLYLDGALEGTTAAGNAYTGSEFFGIQGGPGGVTPNNVAVGNYAHLAFYDDVLTSTRVAAHYAAASDISLALSPATITVTPQSLLAPINLLLSPATITVTAQPMGLPISVALSPATITVTPSPLGIASITVALSPATVTVTPQALDVARSVPLTPAVITVTGVNLTAAFLGVPPETKGMSLIAASGYATNPFSVTRTADRYRVVPASPVYSGRATGLVHVYPPEPA